MNQLGNALNHGQTFLASAAEGGMDEFVRGMRSCSPGVGLMVVFP